MSAMHHQGACQPCMHCQSHTAHGPDTGTYALHGCKEFLGRVMSATYCARCVSRHAPPEPRRQSAWHQYRPALLPHPWTQVIGEGDERYLLPLLPFGPNNQALAFRQAVALALMLNRTVLLTGIVEHYSTRRESNGSMHEPMFHRMEDLYNW